MRDASPRAHEIARRDQDATLLRAETRSNPHACGGNRHVTLTMPLATEARGLGPAGHDLFERAGATAARERHRGGHVLAERGARVDFVNVGRAPAAALDDNLLTGGGAAHLSRRPRGEETRVATLPKISGRVLTLSGCARKTDIYDGWESQPTSKIDFSGLQPDASLVRIGTLGLQV